MPRRPDNPASRRPGYTLLELVLVMALLCVMAAMAAPTFHNFGAGRRADAAAGQFVTVAQWARMQAVSTGRVYRLNIDPDGRGYRVTAQRDGGFEATGDEFGGPFSFPEGVNVDCDFPQQADGRYVEFQPSGRSDPGNVRLSSADGADVKQIGCLSATELFQVLPPGATVNWGGWVAAKQQAAQAGQGMTR